MYYNGDQYDATTSTHMKMIMKELSDAKYLITLLIIMW